MSVTMIAFGQDCFGFCSFFCLSQSFFLCPAECSFQVESDATEIQSFQPNAIRCSEKRADFIHAAHVVEQNRDWKSRGLSICGVTETILLLKLHDLSAKGGFRNPESMSGSREIQLIGQNHSCIEMTKFKLRKHRLDRRPIQ